MAGCSLSVTREVMSIPSMEESKQSQAGMFTGVGKTPWQVPS